MAVQQNKKSPAKRGMHRAHDFLTAHSLAECPNCHEKKMPHRVCPKCGYYKGREVIEVESK